MVLPENDDPLAPLPGLRGPSKRWNLHTKKQKCHVSLRVGSTDHGQEKPVIRAREPMTMDKRSRDMDKKSQ